VTPHATPGSDPSLTCQRCSPRAAGRTAMSWTSRRLDSTEQFDDGGARNSSWRGFATRGYRKKPVIDHSIGGSVRPSWELTAQVG
jgi:hypothetical protein